jgi:hypothetical protein
LLSDAAIWDSVIDVLGVAGGLLRRRRVMRSMSGSWSPSSKGTTGDLGLGVELHFGVVVVTGRGAVFDGLYRETLRNAAKTDLDLQGTIYSTREAICGIMMTMGKRRQRSVARKF